MSFEKELAAFNEQLRAATRPLIFYDDDADGLCSFLLTHKANSQVIAVRAARGPELGMDFLRKVEENMPDLVVILDKPRVREELLSQIKVTTYWIDHHDPNMQKPHEWNMSHLHYLNPHVFGEDPHPTAYWTWKALGGPLWIAGAGSISDWDNVLADELKKEYPSIIDTGNAPEELLYKEQVGQLIRTLNFSMKGKSSQVRKTVRAWTRVEDPFEVLKQSTPRGKYIMKQTLPIWDEYVRQRSEAKQGKVQDGVFVHVYSGLQTSLVAEVANEMLVEKEASVIIIGRRSNGEVKFSMRSHKEDCTALVHTALSEVRGYGGGHKEACGGAVDEDDWSTFIDLVKTHIHK